MALEFRTFLLGFIVLQAVQFRDVYGHADAECPVNWIEYDNFCYWVQDQVARTYADAQADCNGRGAALTSINSATEQNFIFNNLFRKDLRNRSSLLRNLVNGAAVNIIWIGLNDLANEGTYVWEDGNTFAYDNFGSGEPNNQGNEDCVQLFSTGDWNDLSCATTNGYICKMKRTHFWIESAQYIGKEGTTLIVNVHRDGLLANDDEVTLTATDLTAVRGTDYTTAATRTLTFPSGEELATVTYQLDSDTTIEDLESFTLTLALSGATAAGTVAGVTGTVDSPSTTTVFIEDCTAKFWIEEVEYVGKENENVVVTVHRERNYANSDEITLLANDVTATFGIDYSTPSGTAVETVTIPAGATSVTVTYNLLMDTAVKDLETFTLDLVLSGATAANNFATVISPSTTTVEIEDCTATFWIEEDIYIGKENTNLVITVHRDGNLRNTDTVVLTSTDGTAVYGTDYSSASGTTTDTINFAAGATSSTVSYTLSSDTAIEDIETFTLALTLSGATAAGGFAALLSPTTSTVYIMDCTAVFWIEEVEYIAKENTNLVVTVHRRGNLANTDTATLTSTDGTATYNNDYSSLSGTNAEAVNFAAGQTTATVTYTISPDTVIEDIETFTLALTLSGATAANNFATLGSPSSSTVYIIDCTAVFWIEEAQYVIKENSNLVVIIHREGNLANADTLTLTSADVTATYGADYTSPSGTATETVTFAAGALTSTVIYPISSDTLTEDTETFTLALALSGATAASVFARVHSPSSSTVYILDCTAVFWIEEAQYIVKENTNLVVTIHRTGNLVGTDTLTLTATDVSAVYGTDYSSPTAASEAVNFAIGDTSATVTYTVNSDTLTEDIETLTLTLAMTGATNTNNFARVGSPSSSTVYIIDCTAVFWIEEVMYIGKENTNVVVTVHRDGNLGNSDLVVLTSSDVTAVYGTDYSSLSGTSTDTLTFAAGDTTSTITYTLSSDTEIEDMESFTLALTLSGTTATNAFARVGSPGSSTVYILDCTAFFWIEEDFYIAKENVNLVVTVHRERNFGSTDEVTLTSTDGTAIYGTDYSSQSGTATETVNFAIGDTSATVTYTINSDTLIEDMETFTLDLALAGTTATNNFATIISPISTTVYIFDCTAVFWIEEAQYIGKEDVALVVTVHRKHNLANSDSITLSTTDETAVRGTDYSAASTQTVTFAAGETTAVVTYNILSDTETEDVESFALDLALSGTTATDLFATITEPSSSTVYITDCTAVFWIEESTYTTKEGTSLLVTIHRRGNRVNTDTLTLTSTPGTATFLTDYTSSVNSLIEQVNFAAGDSSVTITYPISTDTLIEDTETFTLRLTLRGRTSTDQFATIVSPSVSYVYITDCTARFWIEEAQYTTKENTNLVVTIHRDGNLVNTDEVTLTATDEAAVYFTDYTSASNTSSEIIQFASGDTTATMTYTLAGDTVIEDTESFVITLALSGATSTNLFATVTSPSTSKVYIRDCTAVFWIEGVHYLGKENTDVVVSVRRAKNLNVTDEISLTATDVTAEYGTDYDSSSNGDTEILNFAVGDTIATATYTLRPDTLIEDLETFTLSLALFGTTATNQLAAVGSPAVTTVTVVDCTSYFWIEDKQCYAFERTTLVVTFHRGGYLGRRDSIRVTYTNGRASFPVDFSPLGGEIITFDVGQTTATKSISINADNELEYNEMFEIEIFIPESDSLSDMATLYSPWMSEVIIKDPTWYVFDCADYSVDETAGIVVITIVRKGDLRTPGQVSVVTGVTSLALSAASSSDFVGVNRRVDFTAGEAAETVNINIVGDSDFEGHEQFQVFLQDPGTGEALGELHKAIVTIYDDDIPDACPEDFCENGGVCSLQRDFTFSCTCEPGFTGLQCQDVEEIDTGVLSRAAKIGLGIGLGLLGLGLLLLGLLCCWRIRLRRLSSQPIIVPPVQQMTPVTDQFDIYALPPVVGYPPSNARLTPAFPSLLNMPYNDNSGAYDYFR